MSGTRAALRLAAAVCRRTGIGTGIGALGGVAVGGAAVGTVAAGLIAGETLLAHARIPHAREQALPSDGLWCAPGVPRRRRPVRLAVLGDSTAAGFGVETAAETLPAQVALRLSAALGTPVHVTTAAAVGARSRDLHAQLRALTDAPRADLSLIVVGANDVTHFLRTSEAVRHLAQAVHKLHILGVPVVVGTCPDVGVPVFPEPLRSLARRHSRAFAAAQAQAVARMGACTVDLHGLLGPAFDGDHTMFGPDRFHPSPVGYALAADTMAPMLLRTLAESRPVGTREARAA